MTDLTEAEIQEFVEQLDNPEPPPRRFAVEFVTSPWHTFAEEVVMKIAGNLAQINEAHHPVAMLDMESGEMCACFVLEDIDAALAVARGGAIFHQAANDAGVEITSFERVFCYPVPDNYRPPDEEDYVPA